MYSGDEMYDDDVTSGPFSDDDPSLWGELDGELAEECDDCGARPGVPCRPSCPQSRED